MPKGNQYPTSRWLTEEIVIDTYEIDLPPGIQGGEYPVEVGLYIPATGQRLQIKIRGEAMGDALQLQPLSTP